MKNERNGFTSFEYAMVVVILLFVVAIAAQAFMDSVVSSEETTVHAATSEYSQLRSAYLQHDAIAAGDSSASGSTTPDR